MLRFGGSASARDVVTRLLAEFRKLHPDVRIAHAPSTHSGSALKALRSGELDVAYVTREPREEERAGLYVYPFAKDPLVLAAHRGTGVIDISVRELRQIYGGQIDDWAGLGGKAMRLAPGALVDCVVCSNKPQARLAITRQKNASASGAGLDLGMRQYQFLSVNFGA